MTGFSDSDRVRLDDQDNRLDAGADRMARMEAQLADVAAAQAQMADCLRRNTELTAAMGGVVGEVRDLMELGRTGMKVVNWIGTTGYRIVKVVGTVAAAIAAVYVAWQHITQRGAGIAKLHGHEVKLLQAPAIGAVRVLELDYIPEIGLATIQTQTERRRDMTAAEQRECDALLKELLP